MDDISTHTLMHELLRRMEHHIYEDGRDSDTLLTDMPKEDTMGMYFALEEYMLCYAELIEERRHM